jgi:hypothetical protein
MKGWPVQEQAARSALKDLLLAGEARADLVLPSRGKRRRRVPKALG